MDEADTVFKVVSGLVLLTQPFARTNYEFSDKCACVCGPEDTFGGLFGDDEYREDATTLVQTQVQAYRLEDVPSEVLLPMTQEAARNQREATAVVHGGSVRTRVARMLALLCRKYFCDNDVVVKITHQMLAELIAVTRESVTRALNELEMYEYITLKHSSIEVHDATALEEILLNGLD
ncbi:MAG: Crp/Fnr family transcriptional regulator [Candidatus Campbellbacteria bacterium]|nr:Crp/Fnr family transcriptional regulator [Candidatus Campbellbacteria bacterium]